MVTPNNPVVTATVASPPSSTANSNASSGNTPTCKNCHTSTTPLWRRDEHGAVLCNACGLFLKLHGRPRPISLKTDVIKPRNRKSTHGDSPGDKKRKDPNGSIKKRKMQDPKELHAAETLEHLMHNGKVANALPTNLYHNVMPAVSGNGSVVVNNPPNSPPPNNVALPHLSMLLGNGSIPGVEQKTTPSLTSASVVQTATPMSKQFSHIASINEILNNSNGAKTEKQPISAMASPPVHTQVLPSLNTAQSPTIAPVLSQGYNSGAQSAVNNSSKPDSRQASHYSNSPPPMDLQRSIEGNLSSTSTSSNQPGNSYVNNSDTPLNNNQNYGLQTNGNVMTQENQPPLALVLQNQEETIRLKTRISELELVVDLYKRHIFELDAKCKMLEGESKRV